MESSQTTTESVTTRAAGIRYGIIGGVVGVLYFLAVNVTGGNMTEGPLRWVSYLVTLVVVFLAHKYYKDNGNGFMTYGQGITIALWTGLVSAVIGSVFFYIYVKFVDSAFIDMIRDKQIEQMEQRGMSQEQIDQAMKFAGMFMKPETMFLFGLIGGVISNIICGLLVGIFTQKKAPEQAF